MSGLGRSGCAELLEHSTGTLMTTQARGEEAVMVFVCRKFYKKNEIPGELGRHILQGIGN